MFLALTVQGIVPSTTAVVNAAIDRYSPPKDSEKAIYLSGLKLDKMKGTYYTTKKEEYIVTSRFILYLDEGIEVPVNVIELINYTMDMVEKETGYRFYVQHINKKIYSGMTSELDNYFTNAEKFKKIGGDHEKVEIVVANQGGYVDAYSNDANGILLSGEYLQLSDGNGNALIHELLHVAWLRNGCYMGRVLCEGFATYFTDCIIEKDKVLNCNFDSHDQLKNYDYLISEDTMEEHFTAMTAGQSNYQLGFRLMHFIIEEYGMAAYRKVHKKVSEAWTDGTEPPMKTLISAMKSQLSEDFFEAFAIWHNKNLDRFGDTDIAARGEWYIEFGSYLTRYYGSASHAVIPDTVTNIQPEAFNANNRLVTVEIPDTVTSIGGGAFINCLNLSKIIIPDSVTDLYTDVFNGCTGLKSAVLSKNIKILRANLFWGCSSLKEILIPEGVTEMDGCVFTNCTALKTVTLPSTLQNIGTSSFFGCSGLETIVVPDSVISIGQSAFSDCTKLKNITLSENITVLDNYVLMKSTSLKNIILPPNLTTIGDYTFNRSGLTTIKIPGKVTQIGNGAFAYCDNLKKVEIPSSVKSIGADAFIGSTNIIIYGKKGSYAETYAKQNSIKFSAIK
jgi:hypothetical protein